MARRLNFLPSSTYLFRFRPYSGQNRGSKLGQNCKLWVRPVTVKTWIFQRLLKHTSNLDKYYHWWYFQQSRTIFGRVRVQTLLPPPPGKKKGHFMDAKLVQKFLEIYNLTATNAILIKRSSIMYAHEIFYLAKTWGVTDRA